MLYFFRKICKHTLLQSPQPVFITKYFWNFILQIYSAIARNYGKSIILERARGIITFSLIAKNDSSVKFSGAITLIREDTPHGDLLSCIKIISSELHFFIKTKLKLPHPYNLVASIRLHRLD